MPAVTRSAARSNAPRSRIEDPTPDGCSMTTRRTRSRNLRTTLKRKLTVNTEGGVDDEPARKVGTDYTVEHKRLILFSHSKRLLDFHFSMNL